MPFFHLKAPWKSDSPRQRGSKTARASKSIVMSDVNQGGFTGTVETAAGSVQMYHGMAHLPADSRGREIVAEYKENHAIDPKNVGVADNRPTRWRDPVHNYFFGSVPEMPWKRHAESTET